LPNKRLLKIGLSGLNVTDNPSPGVPMARGLKEATSFDAHLIGLSYENLEPGIYRENLFSKIYQLPYPSSGHEILLQRLAYIHEKEKLDIIIPNFDSNFMLSFCLKKF